MNCKNILQVCFFLFLLASSLVLALAVAPQGGLLVFGLIGLLGGFSIVLSIMAIDKYVLETIALSTLNLWTLSLVMGLLLGKAVSVFVDLLLVSWLSQLSTTAQAALNALKFSPIISNLPPPAIQL